MAGAARAVASLVDFGGCDRLKGTLDGSIGAAIPSAQTVDCVVQASRLLDAPGVIRHHLGTGLILGEASGQPSERVKQLAETFMAAGFNASTTDQIQRDVWYKLWGNMTMNPISAITGATTDKILGDDPVRGFVTSAMLEAKEIGARFGIAIDQAPDDRHEVTLKLGAMKTSMLQDVLARKRLRLMPLSVQCESWDRSRMSQLRLSTRCLVCPACMPGPWVSIDSLRRRVLVGPGAVNDTSDGVASRVNGSR